MTYASIIHKLPQDIQYPMLELIETLQRDMREQYAVRRQDFEALSAVVAELAQAQKRTEERVEELAQAQKRAEERLGRLEIAVEELARAQKRTEERVEELAQAQKRAEERLGRLEIAVEELARAQKRTEERVEELARAQKRTEERVEELAQAQKRTEEMMQKLVIRVGKNTGKLLELDYRDKAYAYFGSLLRKVKVVSLQELEPTLEEHLTEAEFNALLSLDLLIEGQVRNSAVPDDRVYVAVEVSAVIDENDVKRAQERAALLRRAGFRVVPAVAGEDVTEGAIRAAQEGAVLLVQDGIKQNWERALAAV
jgi:DNA repair exonuclease SbcCD ATPase subunit